MLVCTLCRQAWGLDQESIAVDYRDGAYFGQLAFNVAVSPALALLVLTDFDHMAEFMPGVTSSRILAREGNVYRVAQRGKASLGPLSVGYESERRIEVIDGVRILSQSLSGTAKRMISEMRLSPAGKGTRLEYRIEMVPGNWVPGFVAGSFFRAQLAEQFSALEREMLKRQ